MKTQTILCFALLVFSLAACQAATPQPAAAPTTTELPVVALSTPTVELNQQAILPPANSKPEIATTAVQAAAEGSSASPDLLTLEHP